MMGNHAAPSHILSIAGKWRLRVFHENAIPQSFPGQALPVRDGRRHARPEPVAVLFRVQRLYPRGPAQGRLRADSLPGRNVPLGDGGGGLHHVRHAPLLEGGAQGGADGARHRQPEPGLPEPAAGVREQQVVGSKVA